MRVALVILTAVALAVALIVATGGDDESTVETTPPVTITETVPVAPDTTPSTPPPDAEAPDPDAPANGHGGAEAGRTCGHIAFNPSTDSGASGITAVGTDCATARAVARGAANAADELAYESRGFRCTGAESDEPGLSAIEWACVGAAGESVSFETT
jgi:hypothetical protein